MAPKAELTERQRYWLEHVASCERSGQTTKAYAQEQGLSVAQLYSWRRELVEKGVWPDPAQSKKPVHFDRMELGAMGKPASEWRIVLPNGIEVGFNGRVEKTALLTVLAAVHSL